MMKVAEIEKEIKPLSRQEKEALFRFLAEELEKDDLLKYFKPGQKVGLWSPFNEYKMAEQLQTFLKEQSSS